MRLRFCEQGALLWWEAGPRAVTYGAIAKASGESKSLVSHHFKTQKALLRACAETLAEKVAAHLEQLANSLSAADPRLCTPEDVAVLIVERLLDDERRYAIAFLEIASLAAIDREYAPLAARMLRAIDAALAKFPDRQALLRTIILGEILSQAPLPPSPAASLGLRARIAWFLAPPPEWRALLRAAERFEQTPSAPASPAAPAVAPDMAKPERIVAAAVRLLARGEEPTHRAIAAEAGVPLAATTYYFRSRVSIFERAYEQIVEAIERRVETISTPKRALAPERLTELIGAMVPFFLSVQTEATIAHLNLALIAAREPELQSWAEKAHETEAASVEAYLGKADYASSNVARGILAFQTGLVLRHLLSDGAAS